MVIDFEIIETFFLHDKGQFIIARILDSEINFEMKNGAIFGGIPIYPYVDMPRSLDENKKPRLDVFVFKPLIPTQKCDFVKGQTVELVIPD
jgi:hypothetical protein